MGSNDVKMQNSKQAENTDMPKPDSHSIGLAGVRNARELGGYLTSDGREVKRGVLLRTAGLNTATEDDINKLKCEYHLSVCIDFRSEMERTNAPEPVIDGVRSLFLPVIDIDEMMKQYFGKESPGSLSGAPDISSMDQIDMLIYAIDTNIVTNKMYIEFLASEQGQNSYHVLFEELYNLHEGNALLFHCTQGKDRTGIAAMLILGVLGIDEDTILRDYELTNTYNSKLIEYEKHMLSEKGIAPENIDKYLSAMDRVDVIYMKNAIDYLNERYGSIEGYVKTELRISDEMLRVIKQKYLMDR